MTTTVAYHADGYSAARPAINVKLYTSHQVMCPPEFQRAYGGNGSVLLDDAADRYINAAYERVVSDFWQAAEELADQYGLGAIVQEGRSGGWLVFTDGRDPAEYGTLTDADTLHGAPYSRADWLRSYSSYRDWANDYIDKAPSRVARIAQDMAMDELGSRAIFLGRLRWPGYEVSTQTYELSTR